WKALFAAPRPGSGASAVGAMPDAVASVERSPAVPAATLLLGTFGISAGGSGTGTTRAADFAAGAAALSVLISNACAGATATSAVPAARMHSASAIRIGNLLRLAAGMRHGAVDCGADFLRVFPEIAGLKL